MQWTHEELKSFPTEDILNSGQLSSKEILKSGSLFICVSIKGYNVDIDSGYFSGRAPVQPIVNWATTDIFDTKHHGWKKVIVNKEYDPSQQPYTEDDI